MVGVHTNLLAPQVKGKLACVLQKKTIGRGKKQCANLAARIIFWLSTGIQSKKYHTQSSENRPNYLTGL